MPLDPSIILSVKPPVIQGPNPLETLQAVTQIQGLREQTEARRLAGDKARQQAADEAAIRRVLTETGGDIEKALPQLRQIAPKAALEFETEIASRKEKAASALTHELDVRDKQFKFGLGVLNTMNEPAGYQAGLPIITALSPELAKLLPPTYDPDALARVTQAGLTAKELHDQRKEGLDRFLKGDAIGGLSRMFSTAQSQAHWDNIIQGAHAVGGADTDALLAQFGPTWSPEAVAHATALGITPEKRAELNKGADVGTFSDYVVRRFGANPSSAQIEEARKDYANQAESGALGDFADYLRRKFGPTPTAAQIEQARKEYAVPAPSYIWAVAPGGEVPQLMPSGQVIATGAQKPPEPSTAAQSAAAGYAARVAMAEPTFTKVSDDIRTMSLPAFELQTNSWFAKPTFQSPAVQNYMQAARNFINANLRRESGAAISPTEFAEARAQYLPQPGDTAEAKALKATNRAQILANLKNEAGRAYQPPVGTAPANVAAVLKDVAPGRHTLSDGSVWEKHADGSIVKAP